MEIHGFLTANSQRDHYEILIFNRGKQLFADSKCYSQRDYYEVVIFIVESNCFLTANSQRDHYEVVIFIVESNGLLTVNVIYRERLL